MDATPCQCVVMRRVRRDHRPRHCRQSHERPLLENGSTWNSLTLAVEQTVVEKSDAEWKNHFART